MRIRPETAADADAITAITKAAFRDHPYSRQTEHAIVLALRHAGALTLSLVAEDDDGTVVGHLAASPITISDGTTTWAGLGPLSVRPDRQRQGIGSTLLREGLARLRAQGIEGCALVGDPAYYTRFGFRPIAGLTLDGVPPENVLALPFTEAVPQGVMTFHTAFMAEA